MAYVACGRFDGFWQRNLNYWDIAAGIILIKEAGGFIEILWVIINMLNKMSIIASNSLMHQDLLIYSPKKILSNFNL